jgi:hypothetical protein
MVLGARYNGTHYKVRVKSGGAYINNVPDQYATIDVTAKSGALSRRLRTKVALFKGTAALDYALFSDDDLCKNFSLRDSKEGTAAVNLGGCPF